MDAIDCALARFEENRLTEIEYTQYPVPAGLHERLKSVSSQSSLESITRLDVALGNLFAEACLQLINNKNLQAGDITAIGSHGQTVLHRPEGNEPTTMQIGDPNIIAYRTGITTIADFRRMDMAAGGQGAPLVPAFHEYYFRSGEENRIILNIGGIANITYLPQDIKIPVTGFDTGPGNVLMDDWANRNINKPMDVDGQWAQQGEVQHDLLDHLLGDDYFRLPPPKSTGRDYFNIEWLMKYISTQKRNYKSEDIQATLVLLTARSIADCIPEPWWFVVVVHIITF